MDDEYFEYFPYDRRRSHLRDMCVLNPLLEFEILHQLVVTVALSLIHIVCDIHI